MPDFLKKILGSIVDKIPGAGPIVKDLLFQIDDEVAKLPPEKRVEFELALRQIGLEEFKTEINAKVDLMKAELKAHWYVWAARPTGTYIFYLASLFVVIVHSIGAELDTAIVLSVLGPLGGNAGWYTWNRSQDKRNGNGK